MESQGSNLGQIAWLSWSCASFMSYMWTFTSQKMAHPFSHRAGASGMGRAKKWLGGGRPWGGPAAGRLHAGEVGGRGVWWAFKFHQTLSRAKGKYLVGVNARCHLKHLFLQLLYVPLGLRAKHMKETASNSHISVPTTLQYRNKNLTRSIARTVQELRTSSI